MKEILSPLCPSGHSSIIYSHRRRVPDSNALFHRAFYGTVRFIFSSSSLKERALKSAHPPTSLDQVKLPGQRQPPLTSPEDTSARKLLPLPPQSPPTPRTHPPHPTPTQLLWLSDLLIPWVAGLPGSCPPAAALLTGGEKGGSSLY